MIVHQNLMNNCTSLAFVSKNDNFLSIFDTRYEALGMIQIYYFIDSFTMEISAFSRTKNQTYSYDIENKNWCEKGSPNIFMLLQSSARTQREKKETVCRLMFSKSSIYIGIRFFMRLNSEQNFEFILSLCSFLLFILDYSFYLSISYRWRTLSISFQIFNQTWSYRVCTHNMFHIQ